MNTLFTNAGKDLKSLLESLQPADLQLEVDSATYFKGQQYYDWGLVGNAAYNFDKSELSAHVAGSRDYTVRIALQQDEVQASCNCPVEGVCKHMVATLLYASQEAGAIEIGESRSKGSALYKQLLELPREELVERLLAYAPDEFLLEIHNRHASDAEAQVTYTKAEAGIRKLFTNTELLYSPQDFTEALHKQVSRLAGLEQQLQEELGPLIFYIIRKVEEAFDKGYLYDDEEEMSFELPDAFISLVEHYIRVLPYADKTRFLKKLDDALSDTAYEVFESLAGLSQESFEEGELPAVKDMLLKDYRDLSVPLTEEYYVLVRPLLSDAEKEQILLYLKDMDSGWVLELAYLYKEQGAAGKAIDMIRSGLHQNPAIFSDEQVYLLYLELLGKAGGELAPAFEEAITEYPSSSMLEKISSLRPGQTADYERLLEQHNPQALLVYLEKAGRLEEGLQLLQRNDRIWDHYRWVFFKKHIQDFPEEGVAYFSQVIEGNLPHTGNPHYYKIVEALKQIQLVDPPQATALAPISAPTTSAAPT
ncbi:SWIM zinc finger family protein [Cesiribacter andamanensis]|uniref:SWIM-type domain-containing protein n=1 Tax=Cesiribacter andamanensis AMV16 TaxID=1279009 RepID=M7NQT2_9BACT|nr:SWIM zinc finger family protein [Cesiribacter andamanensis]EMR00854.1 hypothetical protein ADICEAN_04029 [Cesiribacter andamanensis AMV16]